MTEGINEIVILSMLMFGFGLLILLIKRHVLFMLIGIELMFNAANLNLVLAGGDGVVFALFVMAVAAIEAAVVLVILLKYVEEFNTTDTEKIDLL